MASFELPNEFRILRTLSGLGKPTLKIRLAPLLTAAFLLTIVYFPLVQGTGDCSCSSPACIISPPCKFSSAACVQHSQLTPSWPSSCAILYPLELVETPLVSSRSGCVWLSHHNSMVDTILHCWAHNHCLLTCPRCVHGFAGLMVLKTNPSDPLPVEIMLGSLGCRGTCVEQGVKERRKHGASFKDQRFQLQTLLFCNLGYFLAVHVEKKRGIVW